VSEICIKILDIFSGYKKTGWNDSIRKNFIMGEVKGANDIEE
jgi:hypothetical protein